MRCTRPCLALRQVDVRGRAADAQRLGIVRARGLLLAVVVSQRHLIRQRQPWLQAPGVTPVKRPPSGSEAGALLGMVWLGLRCQRLPLTGCSSRRVHRQGCKAATRCAPAWRTASRRCAPPTCRCARASAHRGRPRSPCDRTACLLGGCACTSHSCYTAAALPAHAASARLPWDVCPCRVHRNPYSSGPPVRKHGAAHLGFTLMRGMASTTLRLPPEGCCVVMVRAHT